MVLLEPDAFLAELAKFFQNTRTNGSVLLTMKKYDGRNKPKPDPKKPPLPEPTEYMCLIRAQCRTKKISAIIHQKDVNKFQMAYSSLLRNSIDGLKKLKKARKTKATQ